MDKLPTTDPTPMEHPNPSPTPLAGLDPAGLLRQGAAEDTILDGSVSFDPPSPEELAPLFPQFEILELIGQGGMGAVYKARQKQLDRIVALKILPPAIGQSPAFSNRFTREAKALAKLNHPGIVTIHEFGQRDGLYFILMEFVDGMNLAQLMKAGRISPREALAIVPQICDALQFAHDQGIVHRDIKPENILLDRLGRVKVADFGIAKVIAAAEEADAPHPPSADATLAGKIIGTPAYMAPEQIEHPSEVDHRADIYALGVVFYQMLTGELPGKDKRLDAPSRKVQIDVRLDEIVLQAMEKNPELRFQHASVMKTRVDEVGAAPAPARNAMHEAPAAKGRSTVAIVCAAIALVFALPLLVLGILMLFWQQRAKVMEKHAAASARSASAEAAQSQIRIPQLKAGQYKPGTFAKPAQVFTLERGRPWGGVDLDTGTFVPYEPAGGIDYPEGALRWREEHGIDLILDQDSASPGVLLSGTDTQDVAKDWWDVVPEAALVESILFPFEKGASFDERMTFLAAAGPSAGTRTHVYRTLAGSVGILRLGPTYTAHGVRAEWHLIVDRHPVEQAVEKEAATKTEKAPVVLVIKAGGELFLMGEQVTTGAGLSGKLASLKQQNPDLAIAVKADERVSYSRITETLDQLAKLGITQVSFATTGNADAADVAPDPAKAIEPPKLQFLAWQDEVQKDPDWRAWRANGDFVTQADMKLPRRLANPSTMDVSQTKAAARNPRFLCLWISHPAFDDQSVMELELLDEAGQPLETPTKDRATASSPASPENQNLGWMTASICAGSAGSIPATATLRLTYSAGPRTHCNQVPGDYHGTMTLSNGVFLTDPGQGADGKAFIQLTRDLTLEPVTQQFDFVAVTKDGRTLERSGHSQTGMGKVITERTAFDVPLAQVKSFRCRKRPIRTITFPHIPLP